MPRRPLPGAMVRFGFDSESKEGLRRLVCVFGAEARRMAAFQ